MAVGAKLTKSVRKPSGFQQLGLIWPGQLLLSLLTSLPELVTGWRAAAADAPGLAAGNVSGSILFNLFNITLAGLVRSRRHLLPLVEKGRILTAVFSIIILLAVSLSGILLPFVPRLGRLGINTILLAVIYWCGSSLLMRSLKVLEMATGRQGPITSFTSPLHATLTLVGIILTGMAIIDLISLRPGLYLAWFIPSFFILIGYLRAFIHLFLTGLTG